MIRIIYLFIFLFCFFDNGCFSQTISTLTGTYGTGAVYSPGYLALDQSGNIYFAEELGNKICKLDTSGILTTIAGNGSAGFSGDGGLASLAQVNQPSGITLDSIGNVIFTDNGNHRVRRIDVSTGLINTICGSSIVGSSGDGASASAALLSEPTSVCFDRWGNLYITDGGNHNIRKINNFGIINTIAGNGILGSAGDGGEATSASLEPQYNLCIDYSGNIYLCDGNNHTIRKIDTLGIIHLFAGDSTGSYTYLSDGVPALGSSIDAESITLDKDQLLVIADTYNNRIRKIDSLGIIHTIVGNGVLGYSGDGGLATSAEISRPAGIAFDSCGNLFFLQISNPCIRKVVYNPYCFPTKAIEIENNNANIYPNPTQNEMHIDNVKTEVNYTVFNITGIIELSGKLNEGNNTLSIKALSPGLYILELMSDTGERVVRKIVKN